MTKSFLLILTVGLAAFLPSAPLFGSSESTESDRQALMALEPESHQRWLEGDVAALDALMWEEFHFIAMNGALETKNMFVGGGGEAAGHQPRVLQISELRVEPEEVLFRGETAVVISLLHIDATVRGRRLPDQMRILSVFTRAEEEPGWRLMARSITPILAPPPAAAAGEGREQD
jgi:ketosteroid isomerase-like protein